MTAGVATLTLLGAIAVQAMASSVASDRLQLTQIRQRQHINEHKVATLSSQETVLQAQLTQLTRTLQRTGQSIVRLRVDLHAKELEIRRTGREIRQAEHRVRQLNLLLRTRLRILYENGTVSYLDVLFSSTSFSDFLNRMTALSLIVQQNHQLFQQGKVQRDQFVAVGRHLVKDKQSMLAMAAQLAAQQHQQAQTVTSRQAMLADVQIQKQQALSELQQENAAEQNIAATIARELRSDPTFSDTKTLNLGTGPWIWPVPRHYDITSGYGERTLFGSTDFHDGIDIGAPYGTPIVAVADGVVLYAGSAEGFGHWIVLKLANGLLAIYGHMYASGLLVQPGQVVKQGQVIAYVGSDGQSTGPHLHFTVATGFNSQGFPISLNPLRYVHG